MADVIFLHKSLDLHSYPSIALSNSEALASGYPLTNLQDQYKTTRAISNTTAQNQQWKIDLGGGFACDSVGVINHNFTSIAADDAVKLQYADDSGYSTNLTLASNLSGADGGIVYASFGSATKRYWRLYFSSSVPLSAAPYIAQVYLGTKFTHAYRHKLGGTISHSFDSFSQKSWDGTVTGYLKQTTEKKTWSMSFQIITQTYKTNFETFFSSIRGNTRPFLMSLDSGTTWYFVQCTSPDITYTERSATFWEATLEFEEQIK